MWNTIVTFRFRHRMFLAFIFSLLFLTSQCMADSFISIPSQPLFHVGARVSKRGPYTVIQAINTNDSSLWKSIQSFEPKNNNAIVSTDGYFLNCYPQNTATFTCGWKKEEKTRKNWDYFGRVILMGIWVWLMLLQNNALLLQKTISCNSQATLKIAPTF